MTTTQADQTRVSRPFRTTGWSRRKLLTSLLLVVVVASVSCSRRTSAPAALVTENPVPAPARAPLPTITLAASQSAIPSGTSTTLRWSATNADGVSIDNGIGSVGANGTREVAPTASVTYTARATGAGGTAVASARVTVNPAGTATPPPPVPTTPDLAIEELFARNMQSILFDFDRADIRPSEVGKIQSNARFLEQNAEVRFTIGGHADERGSQEYNIGLGDHRASAARQALITAGISAARMTTVSFGEERPVCTNTNEGCWQQNRRAAFTLND
jgi:peptidoglycan-associated lipoprotein